jgi:hypothetical protein
MWSVGGVAPIPNEEQVRTDSEGTQTPKYPRLFQPRFPSSMLASRASTVRNVQRIARSFATVVETTGVKVAAVDYNQATSSVTVLVKAGSRFEPKQGVANALKNFAFKVCHYSDIEIKTHIEMLEIRVLRKDQPLEPFVKVNFMEVFCHRVLDVNIWL